MEAGIQSVDSLSSMPTGIETPDVIDLRKQQRKEPEKPLYQVLEEKEEKIAPGTLLGTTHAYLINTGSQDKSGAKGLICLEVRNQIELTSRWLQKSWKSWTMFCLPSMKRPGRKGSCEVSAKILATWLQRMRGRKNERCKKKRASQRRISSFKLLPSLLGEMLGR